MLAIKGGHVITVGGPVLSPGTVLIQDGKILDVIAGEPPEDAETIDVTGMYVMPGLIDAHSHLGLLGEPMVWALLDVNESTDPVTPHVRAIDAFNPSPSIIDEVRSGGVTCVYTGPGSANVIGGIGFALKLAGDTVDEMRIPGTEGMKMALGENPKRVYGTRAIPKLPSTRLGNAAVMREALYAAIEYGNKRSRDGDKTDRDMRWEALQQVVRGEMKARIHAHRADDILTAMRIAEEFDLDIVIEHATEGYKVAPILAERKVPCTVGPLFIHKSKMELQDINPENPGALARAGVLVAIQVDGASTTRWLSVCAGVAVREGMPEDEAIRAITLNPARILGLDSRLGTLEPGKDADIAVFSGHPLQTLSRCILTMIDGEIVHQDQA